MDRTGSYRNRHALVGNNNSALHPGRFIAARGALIGYEKYPTAHRSPIRSGHRVISASAGASCSPRRHGANFFGEPGKDGQRRPYNFNKVWLDIKRTAGFADLRFHDLRHEAVSRFVEGGLSDQEVSAISGHKSMQMLKRYTHLRAEDLVAKLDKLKV